MRNNFRLTWKLLNKRWFFLRWSLYFALSSGWMVLMMTLNESRVFLGLLFGWLGIILIYRQLGKIFPRGVLFKASGQAYTIIRAHVTQDIQNHLKKNGWKGLDKEEKKD